MKLFSWTSSSQRLNISKWEDLTRNRRQALTWTSGNMPSRCHSVFAPALPEFLWLPTAWRCPLLVCDLNCTPNCYGKTWRLLCPFFRNLHLRENLARDCFTSTASTVTNSVQNISLAVYVIVTNTRLQPLTTTFYNSMLVSFSLLKI